MQRRNIHELNGPVEIFVVLIFNLHKSKQQSVLKYFVKYEGVQHQFKRDAIVTKYFETRWAIEDRVRQMKLTGGFLSLF